MDYKEQIEQAKRAAVKWREKHPVIGVGELRVDCMVDDLTRSITDLLARAEAAEARAEKAERALAHMWYAYENKDAEFPHEYEKEAVKEAEQLLGKWEDVMPKLLKEE